MCVCVCCVVYDLLVRLSGVCPLLQRYSPSSCGNSGYMVTCSAEITTRLLGCNSLPSLLQLATNKSPRHRIVTLLVFLSRTTSTVPRPRPLLLSLVLVFPMGDARDASRSSRNPRSIIVFCLALSLPLKRSFCFYTCARANHARHVSSHTNDVIVTL